MSPTISRTLSGIAVLLLLALAYTGIAGGLDQANQSTHSEYSIGQIVQTALQLAFGLLSVVSIVVWFWARAWSRPVLIVWAVSVGLAGGLAPVVWGHSSAGIGILSGVASLLIAWGIAALLRVGMQQAA